MKSQHSFRIKILSKLVVEGYFDPIRGIYKNLQLTSLLLVKAWTLSSEDWKQDKDLLLPLLFHTVLEAQAREIRQEKEIKGIQIEQEKAVRVFVGNMILYVKNPKESKK